MQKKKEKDNGFDIIIRNHIDDSIKDALVDFAKSISNHNFLVELILE